MILTDAGVLVALFEPREKENHKRCAKAYRNIDEDLITTLACLTEAMYFLGELKGWRGQEKLWYLVESDSLKIYNLTETDLSRMKILMEKYQDTPMDFADASLVVAAESLKTNKIFTLDSDFYVYRINDTKNFEIIP